MQRVDDECWMNPAMKTAAYDSPAWSDTEMGGRSKHSNNALDDKHIVGVQWAQPLADRLFESSQHPVSD